MELEGSLKLAMPPQKFDSGFVKREFVVTTRDRYPQDIKFELVKEKTELIEAFKPGDEVKVQFDIRGNEYNGKYFVNLTAWRIDRAGSAPARPAAAADAPLPDAPPATGGDEEDDLPF